MPRRDAVSRSMVSDTWRPGGLLVARDVAAASASLRSSASELRRPLRELVGVGVLERVLVLRAARRGCRSADPAPTAGRRRCPSTCASFGCRRAMISSAFDVALVARLERDREAPAVGRRVRPVRADERRHARDVRDPCRTTSATRAAAAPSSAGTRRPARASVTPRIEPGVLLREEALRDDDREARP